MLQNALKLGQAEEAAVEIGEAVPTWAADALTAMNSNGITLSAARTLTRGEAAEILYQVYQLRDHAPGMTVLNIAQ